MSLAARAGGRLWQRALARYLRPSAGASAPRLLACCGEAKRPSSTPLSRAVRAASAAAAADGGASTTAADETAAVAAASVGRQPSRNARATEMAESRGKKVYPRTMLGSVTPVGELIKGRGERVFQVSADDTMANAVRKMFVHNVGSLLVVETVCDRDSACKPLGIITERDLTKLLMNDGESLRSSKVADCMTKANALITATPDTDLATVMELMAMRRLRHLPIVQGEHAVGLVSIGDVVRRLIIESREEAERLRDYISGTY